MGNSFCGCVENGMPDRPDTKDSDQQIKKPEKKETLASSSESAPTPARELFNEC